MGVGIVKIKDKYFEWSTIVDAPTTYGMSIEELEDYMQERYGEEGIKDLDKRLKRVDKNGTSFHGRTRADILCCNKAGEKESKLTEEEIYEKFCLKNS